jgi:hypothetical protein
MTKPMTCAALLLGACLTAGTASAQLTVAPVRATKPTVSNPAARPDARRLAIAPVRPRVSKPATDSYKREAQSLTLPPSPDRPSLAALAGASRRPLITAASKPKVESVKATAGQSSPR